eukprot:2469214-Amphidinium_carterae.1
MYSFGRPQASLRTRREVAPLPSHPGSTPAHYDTVSNTSRTSLMEEVRAGAAIPLAVHLSSEQASLLEWSSDIYFQEPQKHR